MGEACLVAKRVGWVTLAYEIRELPLKASVMQNGLHEAAVNYVPLRLLAHLQSLVMKALWAQADIQVATRLFSCCCLKATERTHIRLTIMLV